MIKTISFQNQILRIERAKAKRKCHGCKKDIPPNSICIKHLDEGKLWDGRFIWKKSNSCPKCAIELLNTLVQRQVDFMTTFRDMIVKRKKPKFGCIKGKIKFLDPKKIEDAGTGFWSDMEWHPKEE
jgi:hypothetical protein